MINEKPILVTGMPRSGTTWVGKIISNLETVRYVHEPFNITSNRCACGTYFDKWFTYINTENEAQFRSHLEHILGSSLNKYQLLNVASNVRQSRSLRPVKYYFKQLKATKTLVKDPLAACSTEWLASTFNMNVVIMIRHPAGVVSSYKKLGWSHPFAHFLTQPQLINDYLNPFVDEIEEFTAGNHDVVDQAALLWKLIYYVLQQQSISHDNWKIMRYEDLALNAPAGFGEIFEHLDLKLTSQVFDSIHEASSSTNPVESTDPYSIMRASKMMIGQWGTVLSKDEIKRIHARVGEVADIFYADDEW